MSDVEVRNSMFGSLTGNEAGLVAHYDFNQNGGTTLTNRAATGSKFDGTLQGSPLPRFVDVEDGSEVGLVRSGVFVRGATVQIPVWRTGSTAKVARIRGKLIPRGRRGWDETAAVPFESGFEVGRAEAMLELEFPASVRRAGVREFLVRLEGGEGVGLSALTECRVWSIEPESVPAVGELRMVKMSVTDTQGTSLLLGTWEGFSSDALQGSGRLEGPYFPQWPESLLTVDGLWMITLPDEDAEGQFFRLKR